MAALRRYEAARRDTTDFATLPPSSAAGGADPYRLAPLPGTDRVVGILRGRAALVVLNRGLSELQRLEAPRSPSGLAVLGSRVAVVGDLEAGVWMYRVDDDGLLMPGDRLPLPEGVAPRDVALGPQGTIYVVEEAGDRLFVSTPQGWTQFPLPRGPGRVQCTGSFLVIDCLLAHTLLVVPVAGDGTPRVAEARAIVQDGPFWCVQTAAEDAGLLLAAGGVENHPLDRTAGFFGYVDSFVYVYRIPGEPTRQPVLLSAVNVSELGLVTPKALDLRQDAGGTRLIVSGYGGYTLAVLRWAGEPAGPPAEQVMHPFPAGTSDLLLLDASRDPGPGGPGASLPDLLGANPLLDAWVRADTSGVVVREVEDPGAPARDTLARLGEALCFTTLLSPGGTSEGAHSRFTCETCHFEGAADGRTHFTGRGEVHATTKPLLGLFNNTPLFSRALDPDLATMVHNEFRVAGAGSLADPWFSLRTDQLPWPPAAKAGLPAVVPPDTLRLALMRFFMEFTPRPNPVAAARTHFTEAERRGAALFHSRCAGCHAPRLVTSDPASEVPFEAWERLVFSSSGPIVWASERYARTGVKPYVHEEGARVPSLRRLYRKAPYFTTGTARSLGEVLSRARWVGGTFFHDAAPPWAPADSLDGAAQAALEAFLRLL